MGRPLKTIRKGDEVRYRNFITLFEKFRDEHPGRAPLRRFAEFLGVSENYISQAKNGHKTVGQELCAAVEAAFNLPASWMDSEHPEWHPRDAAEIAFLRNAIKHFRSISNEDKAEMIDLANLLAKKK
jgi:transcriptional regulator with XRE-family HTH domain